MPLDPSFPPSGHLWNHTPSAYGPLFTLLSYALVPLGVGGEMWALKGLTALAGLGCCALIWVCARKVGVRPLTAVAFFALNPLLLVYTIGGGHNDVLMALPLLGGAALVLFGWPLLGGVLFMAAIGIKLSAALVKSVECLRPRAKTKPSHVVVLCGDKSDRAAHRSVASSSARR